MELVRAIEGEAISFKYDQLRTLKGVSLDDAIAKLKEKLPSAAYKPVPGSEYLTDINPAYLTGVATDVFGMCGVGWHYSFDAPAVTSWIQTTSTGKEREMFRADLNYFWVVVTLTDGDGRIWQTEPIRSNGSNDSDDYGYAVRGAITNAIGAAFSKLCWQLPVYQGAYDNKKGKFKDEPKPAVAVDPNTPWWETAFALAKADAKTSETTLGKSDIGKRAIERLKEKIGSADGTWWNAETHLAKALKAYTGKDSLALLTWSDFRRLTRIYGGPYAVAGEQVKDVLFMHMLKPTEWQNVILSIPLEQDMVLTAEMADALNAALPFAPQYLKDKKFDYEAMAASLRKFFIQTAEDATGTLDIDPSQEEEIIY